MKRNYLGLLYLLALLTTQTTGADATPTLSNAAPANCSLEARDIWVIRGPTQAANKGPTRLRVEASSIGTNCATARLSYVIKTANGRVLFQRAYNADDVAAFQDVTAHTAMGAALRSWISTSENDILGSFLPAWPANARHPASVEPEFELVRGISRQTYLAVKANRVAMNCLPDRDDSSFCIIYQNGAIVPFGRQFYP